MKYYQISLFYMDNKRCFAGYIYTRAENKSEALIHGYTLSNENIKDISIYETPAQKSKQKYLDQEKKIRNIAWEKNVKNKYRKESHIFSKYKIQEAEEFNQTNWRPAQKDN